MATFAILELNDGTWAAVPYESGHGDNRNAAARAGLAAMNQEFVVYSVGHTEGMAAELMARRNSGRTTQRVWHEGKWVFTDESGLQVR